MNTDLRAKGCPQVKQVASLQLTKCGKYEAAICIAQLYKLVLYMSNYAHMYVYNQIACIIMCYNHYS